MERSDVEVSIVPTEAVPLILSEIRPLVELLAPSIREQYTVDNLIDYVLTGYYDLWVVIRDNKIVGFIMARIIELPLSRYLSLQFAAGHGIRETSDEIIRVLTSYARDAGCSHIEMLGRKGWARYYKRYGFETAYVAIKKEV